MNFSVSIEAVYGKSPFIQTFQELHKLGFERFEFWTWWDKDLDLLVKQALATHLRVSTFCTKFVSLVDPSQRLSYLEGLAESIQVAKKLGCDKLTTQVGNDTGRPSVEQVASLVTGLKAAGTMVQKAGLTLLVEPLNLREDHAGYFLSSSDQAFAVIDQVANSHVKVLFDIYHQQITEGDLIRRIQANIDKIGHFHAAGSPGRHELDNGEIHYPAVFAAIEALGYKGDVGLEYFPKKPPGIGLKKLAPRGTA